MTQIRSAASPAARAVLRLLIALNWLYGAVVLALLIATVVAEQWILSALGVSQTSLMRPILPGLRVIAALGLVAIPLEDVILRRLLSVVDTVRKGDPFVSSNATHLRAIARVLLAFVLAHVFAAGTRMGEELAGTV